MTESAVGMPLPLVSLLSQTLVAYTIEFDNEFERRFPHRTAADRARGANGHPFLVSMAMWSHVMQFVDEEGTTVRDLVIQSGISRGAAKMLLIRMGSWWGYIDVERSSRPDASPADTILRPTEGGRNAREIWRTLGPEIESRWINHFGSGITNLRDALVLVVTNLQTRWPDYMPIVGYGFESKSFLSARKQSPRDIELLPEKPLSALLSKVLCDLTATFESSSELSAPLLLNPIRALASGDQAVRDLPQLTGVARNAIDVSLGFLEKQGWALVERHEPRRLTATLTEQGRIVWDTSKQLLLQTEDNWIAQNGERTRGRLREALETIVGDGSHPSPLLESVTPYPDGWRAKTPIRTTLPHFPMVLHRGGFPDGA